MLEQTRSRAQPRTGLELIAGPAPAGPPGEFDHGRAAAAVRDLLIAMGEDPEREGLRETPERVARAIEELTAGLRGDPAEPLQTLFREDYRGLVMVRDIDLTSICEHHLLPFYGHAHIAYQPGGGRVTGLSKLARVVDVLAHRPQMQERLTEQLADTIMGELGAEGVAVVVECAHLCLAVRGVRKRGALTVTTSCRGALAESGAFHHVLWLLTRERAASTWEPWQPDQAGWGTVSQPSTGSGSHGPGPT
jgi:GTP cyclohydrolase IA